MWIRDGLRVVDQMRSPPRKSQLLGRFEAFTSKALPIVVSHLLSMISCKEL
jgi:hypothetical protein